jgi:hypothetical protein
VRMTYDSMQARFDGAGRFQLNGTNGGAESVS